MRRCARARRSRPSCRAPRAPRARRSRRRPRSTRPRGARRATCSTARFSVTLIFSPRNMASMRARRPDSLGQREEQLDRLVGDAVLRVVEEQAGRLDRHAFGARRIVGEEFAQVQIADFALVLRQRLPRRGGGYCCSGGRHFGVPFVSWSLTGARGCRALRDEGDWRKDSLAAYSGRQRRRRDSSGETAVRNHCAAGANALVQLSCGRIIEGCRRLAPRGKWQLWLRASAPARQIKPRPKAGQPVLNFGLRRRR